MAAGPLAPLMNPPRMIIYVIIAKAAPIGNLTEQKMHITNNFQ